MDGEHRNGIRQVSCPPDISDDDVLEAMKDVEGYLDITPGDFKVLYHLAYKHALERLARSTKAEDVMTGEVIAVNRETPLGDVVDLMADHNISGVPVVDDDGRVAGIISEKDILSRMGPGDARSFMRVVAHCLRTSGCVAVTMRGQKAEEVMTAPAVTVERGTKVREIAELMTQKNINRVPVVDGSGKLVGIISRADIVRATCSIPAR